MPAAGIDPRAVAPSAIKPVVATSGKGIPTWLLVASVAVIGLLLFLVLDARRQQMLAPSTRARFIDSEGAPAAIPPLYVPPEPIFVPAAPPAPTRTAPTPKSGPTPKPLVVAPVGPPITYSQPSTPMMPAAPSKPVRRPAPSEQTLVYDSGPTDTASTSNADGGKTQNTQNGATLSDERARATMFRNRSTTVAEGTLVPAVLESALDSTRPGPARALVTRDVRGFDGSRVLIPRGSRLIGEYKADLQSGQNRALVIWTRLVRPDGAIISLASPSADTLGRVGIKGSVNNHFLERFASALLQTSLNVGTGLAARAAGGDSIAVLTLPGTISNAASPVLNNSIQPTLRVKQGVSISVFVARDLDFTAVENRK